jgi:hypothetical protein
MVTRQARVVPALDLLTPLVPVYHLAAAASLAAAGPRADHPRGGARMPHPASSRPCPCGPALARAVAPAARPRLARAAALAALHRAELVAPLFGRQQALARARTARLARRRGAGYPSPRPRQLLEERQALADGQLNPRSAAPCACAGAPGRGRDQRVRGVARESSARWNAIGRFPQVPPPAPPQHTPNTSTYALVNPITSYPPRAHAGAHITTMPRPSSLSSVGGRWAGGQGTGVLATGTSPVPPNWPT